MQTNVNNVLDTLKSRSIGTSPIKAPALNLTLGSGLAAALAAAAVVFNGTYHKIFGFTPSKHPTVTAALLVAIIAGYVVVATADIFARAITAVPRDVTHLAPAPQGWSATVIRPGADDAGYTVAGIRFRDSNNLELLIVKDGVAPQWKSLGEVTLQLPT